MPQRITSSKMHSTRYASNKRYNLPKLQNHNFGKLWPKMPHNPFSWGINECFFYHHVLIPTRHIFVCCIIDSLWAVPRTQNFAFFGRISQRFYSHQVWTPKRYLFVVTTLCNQRTNDSAHQRCQCITYQKCKYIAPMM